MTTCELVADRIALGEPIGELAEHLAGCASCRSLAALPIELGASHREADPGLGFTARITAGAQQRIASRRRRRVAGAVAAAVAASAFGAFAVTREPAAPSSVAVTPPAHEQQPTPATGTDHDPWQAEDADDDLRALVRFADTETSLNLSASWKQIEKPLAPYRAVLEGVDHE